MNVSALTLLAGAAGAAAAFAADTRRRHLSLSRSAGWTLPSVLDLAVVAITAGFAAALIVKLTPRVAAQRAIPLSSAMTWGVLACIACGAFIWQEGKRQVQQQRPQGLVCGEWLVLFGLYLLLQSSFFTTGGSVPKLLLAMPVVLGAVVIAIVVLPFVKGREEHRIVQRVAEQGEFVQSEWVPATPECPHPERWRMFDAQSAEIEVLDFLKSLVLTIKPELVVETGTFIGHSAIKIAEALKANGFGRIITIEYDPAVFAMAKQQIDASGLGGWIEYRNASSLDTTVDGQIDILFSDSDPNIREQEVRRFLPQIKPRGLVLIHDASSHFKVVREAAFRLEQEGLLSVVLLSCPRGLCIAQKREGRN